MSERTEKQDEMEQHLDEPELTEDSASQPEAGQEAQASGEQPAPEQAPAKSETQLLQEKVDELNDKLLRTMAEYDNFRRRSQREKEAIYPQATASVVALIVPVVDTVERALASPCSDAEFKKGVEMILHNFQQILGQLGVAEFGEAGDVFSPELHNAVMHVEDDQAEAGTIVEVFQKGYKLGDRIIRHAMVKVAN